MADFVEWVTVLHPRLYYRTCRLVSVATGVATVPLVFLLAPRLTGDRRVGLLAALLLAVCYLHVRDSHFATVDVTMTFFTTLCVLLALEAARTGAAALFAAAGLAAGLAAGGAKYNAGPRRGSPSRRRGRRPGREGPARRRRRPVVLVAVAGGGMPAS